MYAKVFSSIYDGTLREDWKALVTFQQLLVLADRGGFVDMTVSAIVARTGIPIEIIEPGLIALEQPDQASRTRDQEGRRIERIDEHRLWGWRIINYEQYRNKKDAQESLRVNADRAKRFRDKRNGASRCVTPSNAPSPYAEAEAKAEAVSLPTEAPSPDSDDIGPEIWFEEVFWPEYPKKCRKPEALRELTSLLRRTPKSRHDQLGADIMAGLRRYLPLWSDRQFIPDPNRFLKNRRWEDELET